MANDGAETPTVLPKTDFYFVLQTAASDIQTNMSSSPGFAHPATLSDRVLQTEKMTGSPGQTRPLM